MAVFFSCIMVVWIDGYVCKIKLAAAVEGLDKLSGSNFDNVYVVSYR